MAAPAVAATPAVPPPPMVMPLRLDEAILERALEATVFVVVGDASGSGVVVGNRGDEVLVVTNAHVITAADGVVAPVADLVFEAGSPIPTRSIGKVLAVDATVDLALLSTKVVDGRTRRPLPLAPNEPRAGASIFVVGFPYGSALAFSETPDPNVTSGTVAGTTAAEESHHWVAVDAGIHPGNSGGVVIDARGEVMGIAVAKLMGTMRGFFIPAKDVAAFAAAHAVHLSEWCIHCALPVGEARPLTPPAASALDAVAVASAPAGDRWALRLDTTPEGALLVTTDDVRTPVPLLIDGLPFTGRVLRTLPSLRVSLVVAAGAPAYKARVNRARVRPTDVLFDAGGGSVPSLRALAVTSLRQGENRDPRVMQLDLRNVGIESSTGPLFDATGAVRGFAMGKLAGSEISFAATPEAFGDLTTPTLVSQAFMVRPRNDGCLIVGAGIVDDPLSTAASMALAGEKHGVTMFVATARIAPPLGPVLVRQPISDRALAVMGALLPCQKSFDLQFRLERKDGFVHTLAPWEVQKTESTAGPGPERPGLTSAEQAVLLKAIEGFDAGRVNACTGADREACRVGCESDHRTYDCVMYARWLGQDDFIAANALLERVCSDGHGTACGDLALRLARGRGIKEDAERAERLWNHWCAMGWGDVCRVAAGYYCLINPKLEAAYLKRACAAGDPAGCEGKALLVPDPPPPSCRDLSAVACARATNEGLAKHQTKEAVAAFTWSCDNGVARACGMIGLVKERLHEKDAEAAWRKYCPLDPGFVPCRKYAARKK